jgi:hypothetical protein
MSHETSSFAPFRCLALAAIVAALPLVAGCSGGGLYPVEGQVTWKDGHPATEIAGSLIFFEQSEKMTSSQGIIQSDGSFRLKTLEEDDGAPDGDHTVYIIEVGRRSAGGEDGSAIAPGKIHTKYMTPSTSDLRATVKPGTNKITLQVDPWVDPPPGQ